MLAARGQSDDLYKSFDSSDGSPLHHAILERNDPRRARAICRGLLFELKSGLGNCALDRKGLFNAAYPLHCRWYKAAQPAQTVSALFRSLSYLGEVWVY